MRFYDYLCRIPTHRTEIKAQSSGVWESRLRLYPDAFMNMRIAVPPLEEQERIADHLDAEDRKLQNLLRTAQLAVALLEERRTALISAVVTGQIDVRHVGELQPA